jgi:hypothetical protein
MKYFIIIAALLLCGCIRTVTDGKATYRLDPNEAVKYEKVAETSLTIMQVLTPFFPWLAAPVLAGGTAYATYKTQKPKFIKEQTRADLYHDTAGSLVIALENFKETNPAEYIKLRDKLIEKIGPEAENAIRGLRGLLPKA